MNKRQRTVMSRLKPKVKAFGFSRNVIKSIAAGIADKLDIDEDASDEDVNAEIDKAIEAVLPYLPMIQSQANSQFDEWKKAQSSDDEDDEEEDEEASSSQTGKSGKKPRKPKDDEEPSYFKSFRETIEKKLAAIEGARTAETRRGKLEKLIKDSGLTNEDAFCKQILKDFGRMKFENDEEFDEYFSDKEESVKSYNQQLADKGLGNTPPGTRNGGKGGEQPELTDAEIDAIVATMA